MADITLLPVFAAACFGTSRVSMNREMRCALRQFVQVCRFMRVRRLSESL